MKINVKRLSQLGIVCAVMGLVGCQDGTPSCSDERVQGLVLQLVKQNTGNSNYSIVSGIYTSKHNKTKDTYLCSANVGYLYDGRQYGDKFIYTVHQSDDNTEFFVNLIR